MIKTVKMKTIKMKVKETTYSVLYANEIKHLTLKQLIDEMNRIKEFGWHIEKDIYGKKMFDFIVCYWEK